MQTLQIDLSKFRFTELGSHLAILLNNKMQKYSMTSVKKSMFLHFIN